METVSEQVQRVTQQQGVLITEYKQSNVGLEESSNYQCSSLLCVNLKYTQLTERSLSVNPSGRSAEQAEKKLSHCESGGCSKY